MPSRCDWATPSISCGALTPTSSSTVGRTSTAWAYWWRITSGCDPAAPAKRHDARVGHAAFVDLALPALEGGVAGHGPAPRVVVVAEGPTDLFDAAVHLRHPGRVEVGEADVVDRSLPPPSELAPLSDTTMTTVLSESPRSSMKARQPADLGVGVGQVAGEALHEPLGQLRVGARRACPRPGPTAGAATARCRRG